MSTEPPVLNVSPDRSPVQKLLFIKTRLQGKIRRFFRSTIYTKDNDALLNQRKGECTRCGACCMILVRCPFLGEDNGEYSCQIHGQHFAQCQIFPLVPKDLEEVEAECGYYFESK
jgi:hypothetical protein